MLRALALVLIASFAAAGGEKDIIALPLAMGELETKLHAALPVHLSRTGRLTIDMTDLAAGNPEVAAMLKAQRKAARSEATLDLLETYFDIGQKMYAGLRLAAKDKDKLPERIAVVIHADKEAPWLHVAYILQVCVENNMRDVWFAVDTQPSNRHSTTDRTLLGKANGPGRCFVPVPLPKPRAKLDPIPREPGNQLTVAVDIIARTEEFQTRNGHRIAVPTQFRFRVAGREVKTLTGLDKIVADMKRVAPKGATVEAHLTAGQKTPIKYVVAALNRLNQAKLAGIDLLPAVKMKLSTRQLFRLEYPRTNLPLPRQSEQDLDPEEEEIK